MMGAKVIRKLRKNEEGSTLVEFAILAPVIFGLFFGVIQIGISMQAYNSLRAIASDTARFAIVQYMRENTISDTAIKAKALDIAKGPVYSLNSTVEVTITPVATPRVQGTFEKTLLIKYTPPNVLPFFEWSSREITFERPIFLIDE